MEFTIEGETLVIRMKLENPRPSSSGKTLVVASTNGNVRTSLQVLGKPVTVGINAYIAKD